MKKYNTNEKAHKGTSNKGNKNNNDNTISVSLIAGVVDMPVLGASKTFMHIMSVAGLKHILEDGSSRLEILYVFGEPELENALNRQPGHRILPAHSEGAVKMFTFKKFNRFARVQPVVINMQRIYRDGNEKAELHLRVGTIHANRKGQYFVESDNIAGADSYEIDVWRVKDTKMIDSMNQFCKADMWTPKSYIIKESDGNGGTIDLEVDHPITHLIETGQAMFDMDEESEEKPVKAASKPEKAPVPAAKVETPKKQETAPVNRSGLVLDERTIQMINHALIRYGLNVSVDVLHNQVTVHRVVKSAQRIKRSEKPADPEMEYQENKEAEMGNVGSHLGSILDKAVAAS